jgi:hypothetical protein
MHDMTPICSEYRRHRWRWVEVELEGRNLKKMHGAAVFVVQTGSAVQGARSSAPKFWLEKLCIPIAASVRPLPLRL